MASRFVTWVEARLPVFSWMKHIGQAQMPRGLNFMWAFGAVSLLLLVVMIVSGVWLAMYYVPHVDHAFQSVAALRNDEGVGAFMMALHHHGASFLFAALYVHMLRGMYYGSFKKPRELVWLLGMLLLVMMMAVAFMGSVLSWSQSGYWSAVVITNLLTEVPLVGDTLVQWARGGWMLGTATLSRFFLWHILMPCLIVAFVVLHVVAVHVVGSSAPHGDEVRARAETRSFYPYYFFKHGAVTLFFAAVLVAVVALAPSWGVHADALVPADVTSTPTHIVPAWYLTPFYGILRVVTFDLSVGGVTLISVSALGGLLLLLFVFVLFALPWLDYSPVKSGAQRGWIYRLAFVGLLASLFALGYAGTVLPEGWPLVIGRVGLVYYFAYFLLFLPLLGRRERAASVGKSS